MYYAIYGRTLVSTTAVAKDYKDKGEEQVLAVALRQLRGLFREVGWTMLGMLDKVLLLVLSKKQEDSKARQGVNSYGLLGAISSHFISNNFVSLHLLQYTTKSGGDWKRRSDVCMMFLR